MNPPYDTTKLFRCVCKHHADSCFTILVLLPAIKVNFMPMGGPSLTVLESEMLCIALQSQGMDSSLPP